MSTADRRLVDLEATGLDAELFRALAFQPSPQTLELVDRRIARAIEALPSMRRSRRLGRRAGFIALVATSLVLLGSSGSLQLLYGLLSGPFDLPWHRGQVVNQSQVVDGYRVTVDRAYADATRLALAISVVDERERPGISQLMAMSAVVTDDAGEYTSGGGATSSPDGPWAAANVAWKTPPLLPVPTGPRTIHVVVPWIEVRDDATPPPDPDTDPETEGDEWNPWHRVAGPWTFEFEIVVDGGTAIEPVEATAVAFGHELTVTRLIAAPSIVRLDVAVDDSRPGDGWMAAAEIHHNGQVSRAVVGSIEPDGKMSLLTESGLGDPRGEWTVVLSQLSGGDGETLSGPWTITFSVP